MKKYHTKTGLIIAGFVALLAFVPRVMQEGDVQLIILLLNVTVIFMYSLACWRLNVGLIQSAKFPRGIKGQFLRMALSFLLSIIVSLLLLYLFRNAVNSYSFFTFRDVQGKRKIVGMVLFRGAFVNAFEYFIAYILHLNNRNQKAQLENERLKHENLEARLFVLRQQLSPHFLFNSLGILSTLTPDAGIQRYIVQLSNIYRYLLSSSDSHLAALRKEVDFINSYLYIIKERFEDGLQVDLYIPSRDMDRKLPPAALQLLIENAIKHNVIAVDDPLCIKIYTDDECLVVTNNLNPKVSMGESNGIGLYNISERYKLLSKRNIAIEKTANTFTVKMPLL